MPKPLKICICAHGSLGDVCPFVPLAIELEKRGYAIKALVNDRFKPLFDKHGIDAATVGNPLDVNKIRETNQVMACLTEEKGFGLLVDAYMIQNGRTYYQDTLAELDGADFALVNTFNRVGLHAVMARSIPWAFVYFTPGSIPTACHGPLHLPNRGTLINKWTWWLVKKRLSTVENRLRRFLHTLQPNVAIPRFLTDYSPYLNLVASSRYIGQTYPDLPKAFHVTGQWVMADNNNYEPPPDLDNFIKMKSPRVVFAFGSMTSGHRDVLFRLLLDVVKAADINAIIQGQWRAYHRESVPDNVFLVDFIPHAFLFEKVRLVVHHGGSGTTNSACRAGAASIVVNHISDQKYFGWTLEGLGVAGKTISMKDLTVDRLAGRIKTVLADHQMLGRARTLGAKIKAEDDGTWIAVEKLNACFKQYQLARKDGTC